MEAGTKGEAEGFVSIRSNGLSFFFNVFTGRVQNQRTSASKRDRERERERERKKGGKKIQNQQKL